VEEGQIKIEIFLKDYFGGVKTGGKKLKTCVL
jgi:hypothetical protein